MNAYHRVVAEWIESGRSELLPATPNEITVVELAAKFLEHAQTYYRLPDGSDSSELGVFIQAMKPLKKFYGLTRAVEFGPRALKTIRQSFIETGKQNRKTVNAYTSRIKAIFKWGVEQELVPPSVWHGLQAVAGLRRGRTEAKESTPVKPVLQAHIDAVQPYVSRQVWAIIQLQLFTAARAGELVTMRATDIDTSGPIWIYKPTDHKTAHHGIERNIYMGPRAQEVIAPFLVSRPIGSYLFSPIEADKERHAEAECHRRSNQKPNPRKTDRELGEHYTTGSCRRAIDRACTKAGIDSWHPHQLRHNAATWLRKEFGLDVARIILGHRSPAITEIYAELDRDKAITEHGALPRARMHERVREREAGQNAAQNTVPEPNREHARHALARHRLRAFDEDMLRLELLENLDDVERIVLALSVFDIDCRHDFTRDDLRSIQNDQAAIETVVDSTN